MALSRMQLTLHATQRTSHGASRLVHVMSSRLAKTQRLPSRHDEDTRKVYGHMTTAIREMTRPSPILRPYPTRSRSLPCCAQLLAAVTAKLGIKGDETVLDTDVVILRKSFDARNKKVEGRAWGGGGVRGGYEMGEIGSVLLPSLLLLVLPLGLMLLFCCIEGARGLDYVYVEERSRTGSGVMGRGGGWGRRALHGRVTAPRLMKTLFFCFVLFSFHIAERTSHPPPFHPFPQTLMVKGQEPHVA